MHPRRLHRSHRPHPSSARRPDHSVRAPHRVLSGGDGMSGGYSNAAGMPHDQMICPECGGRAYSDSVDVGVGLYVRGNFECAACGWEYEADGMMRVGSYADYFPDQGASA